MKTCIKCGEPLSLTAFSRSAARKDGLHPICKTCDADRRAARRAENLEVERAADNARYAGRRDGKRAYDRAYYAEHAAEIRASVAVYKVENRDRLLPFHAKRQAKRRASKLNQTPPWADEQATKDVYELAAEFRAAGFDVHVDHIVPLQGKRVRGLHWHGNLRVCLASVNMSKGNRLLEA